MSSGAPKAMQSSNREGIQLYIRSYVGSGVDDAGGRSTQKTRTEKKNVVLADVRLASVGKLPPLSH